MLYTAIQMTRIAKLFRIGRSQAVRLPAEFRFDGTEVLIRRDPKTGDVVLSRHPGSWERFFALVKQARVPKDFMSDRWRPETSETLAALMSKQVPSEYQYNVHCLIKGNIVVY